MTTVQETMRTRTRPTRVDQTSSDEVAGAALLEASTETALSAAAELNSMAIPPERANVDAAKIKQIAAEKALDTIANALKSLTSAGFDETNPAVALLVAQQTEAVEAVTQAKAKVASAEKSLANTTRVAKFAHTGADIVKYAGMHKTEYAEKFIGKVNLSELFAGEGRDLRKATLIKLWEKQERINALTVECGILESKAGAYEWLQNAVRRAVDNNAELLNELTDPDLELQVTIRDAGNSSVDIVFGRVSSERRTSAFPSALASEYGVSSWDELFSKLKPEEYAAHKAAVEKAHSEGKSTARSSHELCAKLEIGHPHDGECPYT